MLNRRGFVSGALGAAVGLALFQGNADAQDAPKYPLRFLAKTEYPGDKYACILVSEDLSPGQRVARHMHSGVESSYIATGSITLSIQGEPDLVVKAGDGYQTPPLTPHSVQNGPEKSTIVATFIVEKDKPLVQSVPE
ncbi:MULTISPECIES: cupin domain-containing protein [Paraburkholderia]|uniref:cupin domain-containing protein n=1 Tax=Paraburkholderia TaxID=1822464 RepID=UPI002253B727|nr:MULTISPECIES: cupin domain-containing protein [Paraburkholderia]MCX4161580.1 cupin domain-containing protein [Paraburkholderia megapolitana]MDN7157076.1 cupin domain-containing protein [Paraburkholderia sp. CHISQ3]MDQ6494121.1 cupin domain-containing protein [Paraburkholderia megapolitana]